MGSGILSRSPPNRLIWYAPNELCVSVFRSHRKCLVNLFWLNATIQLSWGTFHCRRRRWQLYKYIYIRYSERLREQPVMTGSVVFGHLGSSFTWIKIHLWRHSVVLALHYFPGMACYRSATLLEVMESWSLWNMFFSRDTDRCQVVFLKYINTSCFSMNKKNRWRQLVSNPCRLRRVLLPSPPLYHLCYFGSEGAAFISDI